MAKGNDKKVVREVSQALMAALGNLLEAERERKYRTGVSATTRQQWCHMTGRTRSTVTHIETGRMTNLNYSAVVRPYLISLRGRRDISLETSLNRVHEGMRELRKFLDRF